MLRNPITRNVVIVYIGVDYSSHLRRMPTIISMAHPSMRRIRVFRLPGGTLLGSGLLLHHHRVRPEGDGQQERRTLRSQSFPAGQVHQKRIMRPLHTRRKTPNGRKVLEMIVKKDYSRLKSHICF